MSKPTTKPAPVRFDLNLAGIGKVYIDAAQAFDSALNYLRYSDSVAKEACPATAFNVDNPIAIIGRGKTCYTVDMLKAARPGSINKYATYKTLAEAEAAIIAWAKRRYRVPAVATIEPAEPTPAQEANVAANLAAIEQGVEEAQQHLVEVVANAAATGERYSLPDGVIDITTPVGKAWVARNEAADRAADLKQDAWLDEFNQVLQPGRNTERKQQAAAELARRAGQPEADRIKAARAFTDLMEVDETGGGSQRHCWAVLLRYPGRAGYTIRLSLLQFLRTSHDNSSWRLPAQLLLALCLLTATSCTNKLSSAYQAKHSEKATPTRWPASDTAATVATPPNILPTP